METMQTPEIESLLATERVRPLKRVEYERLANEGYFDDEKVELLFGMVVPMSPQDASHTMSAYLLRTVLEPQIAKRAVVLLHGGFAANEYSLPEPDLYVVPPPSWTERANKAFLIVEVSRTSLAKDRGPKSLLYSLSDVEEYWLVDLVHERIEVFRDREHGRWNTRATYRRGDTITMRAFPDVTIEAAAILPPEAT